MGKDVNLLWAYTWIICAAYQWVIAKIKTKISAFFAAIMRQLVNAAPAWWNDVRRNDTVFETKYGVEEAGP